MRRFATAALLAAPLLLLGTGVASANPGPCTFGFGCGGYCFRFFPHIHQHGPLYNYGPYYGYPPFEPYGYWNAYLQYTGPVGGYGGGGCAGCGHNKWGQGNLHSLFPGGLFGRFHDGCDGCGRGHTHQRLLGGEFTHVGILERLNRLGHDSCCTSGGGCKSCGAAAHNYVTSGTVFERYTGYGDPDASDAYYVGAPSVSSPNPVIPAGFTGR